MLYQIHLRPAATMLLMAILTGCAQPPSPNSGSAGAPATAAPMAPSADPVAAFVARAEPGATAEIPGQGTARLGRSYNAASGRECREVMLGRGAEERALVYCRGEGQQGWSPARSLLRGGTTRQ
jgi:hypothetical protein